MSQTYNVPALVDEEHGLKVVPESCEFLPDMMRGTVVVASTEDGSGGGFANAIESLGSMAARNLAIVAARQAGMNDPRINGIGTRAYPVNRAGVPLDQVDQSLPYTHADRQVAGYRVSVPLTAKLL